MELRKYYEDLLETFTTPGWKHFMEDMVKDLSDVDSIKSISNEQELFYRKGQMQVLNGILNYESLAQKGLEEMDEDNS